MCKDRRNPRDIIFALSCWIPDSWRKLGPGQVVMRLPKQTRDILKKLKSKDLSIRHDIIFPSNDM